jgi:hypothetical protein
MRVVIDLLRQRVDRVLDTIVFSFFPQQVYDVLSVDFHGFVLSPNATPKRERAPSVLGPVPR